MTDKEPSLTTIRIRNGQSLVPVNVTVISEAIDNESNDCGTFLFNPVIHLHTEVTL